ncbi:MAG TPA: ribonuclease PH [Candidatus Limnocylindrales bacterium]|nr:ribonuclease PH [Candidatus Limnocylindrales bacterium]
MSIGGGRFRADGRSPGQLRRVTFELDAQKWAEGSCIVSFGDTRVLCAASVEDRVPPHLRGKGVGWVTAEYSMLPRATNERTQREVTKGRQGGRTMEIQRLIGRALRGVVDTSKIGDRTVTIDCDVLQADGGTRTASITGGYVALVLALRKLGASQAVTGQIAAVSVGIIDSVPMLDLDYSEDSRAEVDFNVVGTDQRAYVEVQGTAEHKAFDRAAMDKLLDLGDAGLQQLFKMQRTVLGLAAKEPEEPRPSVAT